MSTLVDRRTDVSRKFGGGIVGGLAGGVVFGLMLTMMGTMPMIASMVGNDSPVVGWLIHLGISVFIGITFALLLGDRSTSYGAGALWGAIYGAIWWILGPLLSMPAMLGMPLFMLNSMTLMSLIGHLIYGVLLGLGYVWYLSRR